MPFVYADRVRETSTTTGTGTLTLSGAVTGFQTFSAGIGANNTCFYVISHRSAAEYEVGFGTVGSPATTIARTSVIASSNSGSAVNLSAGTKDVFVTVPARSMPFNDLVAGGRLTIVTGTPLQETTIGSSTIYYTPFSSSTVYLWTGNTWVPYSLASDLSLANTGLTASRLYDIAISWNSGSPTLVATSWNTHTAGGSTRTTAITYQDQIPMVSGNRYIGTIRLDGSSLFTDSSENRWVWNAYNRVSRYLARQDGTASWTMTSTTYRFGNNTSANSVGIIVGLSGHGFVETWLHISATHGTAGNGGIAAFGVNNGATPAFGGFTFGMNVAAFPTAQVANQRGYDKANLIGIPDAGYHTISWIERLISAGGTVTFYGATDRSGISGYTLC